MSQQYVATNSSPSSNVNPNEVRSLWIGDLQYWMDESYLSTCFYHTGEVIYYSFFLQFLEDDGSIN